MSKGLTLTAGQCSLPYEEPTDDCVTQDPQHAAVQGASLAWVLSAAGFSLGEALE